MAHEFKYVLYREKSHIPQWFPGWIGDDWRFQIARKVRAAFIGEDMGPVWWQAESTKHKWTLDTQSWDFI